MIKLGNLIQNVMDGYTEEMKTVYLTLFGGGGGGVKFDAIKMFNL